MPIMGHMSLKRALVEHETGENESETLNDHIIKFVLPPTNQNSTSFVSIKDSTDENDQVFQLNNGDVKYSLKFDMKSRDKDILVDYILYLPREIYNSSKLKEENALALAKKF